MKAVKVCVLLAFAVIVVGIAAIRLGLNQSPEPTNRESAGALGQSGPATATANPATPEGTADVRPEADPIQPPSSLSSPDVMSGGNSKAPEEATPPAKGKEPLKDPVARVALAFVGADPEAEAYWCEAINDPGLSGHERSDLIEDLNEDGLSDPKHPTLDDFPLILNRLVLIQELAPHAMDQVNLDAFDEAYKDLLNLADVALGGGQPVR